MSFTSGSHSASSATSSALRELIRSSRSSRLTLVGATWTQSQWLLPWSEEGLYLLYHLVHGEGCGVFVCEDQQQYGNISVSVYHCLHQQNWEPPKVSESANYWKDLEHRSKEWGYRNRKHYQASSELVCKNRKMWLIGWIKTVNVLIKFINNS